MAVQALRPALLRASDMAMAASDNLIIARAFAGRSDHRRALYEDEARASLETALALLSPANDGDDHPTPPAARMAAPAERIAA